MLPGNALNRRSLASVSTQTAGICYSSGHHFAVRGAQLPCRSGQCTDADHSPDISASLTKPFVPDNSQPANGKPHPQSGFAGPAGAINLESAFPALAGLPKHYGGTELKQKGRVKPVLIRCTSHLHGQNVAPINAPDFITHQSVI